MLERARQERERRLGAEQAKSAIFFPAPSFGPGPRTSASVPEAIRGTQSAAPPRSDAQERLDNFERVGGTAASLRRGTPDYGALGRLPSQDRQQLLRDNGYSSASVGLIESELRSIIPGRGPMAAFADISGTAVGTSAGLVTTAVGQVLQRRTGRETETLRRFNEAGGSTAGLFERPGLAREAFTESTFPSANVRVSPVPLRVPDRVPLIGGRSFQDVDIGVKGAIELATDPLSLTGIGLGLAKGAKALGRAAITQPASVPGRLARAPASLLLGTVGDTGARLPDDLAMAAPRYNFGKKQFTITFDSDLDRAAYITAQAKPSKRDADFLKFVMENTGLDEVKVRENGRAIRAYIKAAAVDAEPGDLSLPSFLSEKPRPKVAPFTPEEAVRRSGQVVSSEVSSPELTRLQAKLADLLNDRLTAEQYAGLSDGARNARERAVIEAADAVRNEESKLAASARVSKNLAIRDAGIASRTAGEQAVVTTRTGPRVPPKPLTEPMAPSEALPGRPARPEAQPPAAAVSELGAGASRAQITASIEDAAARSRRTARQARVGARDEAIAATQAAGAPPREPPVTATESLSGRTPGGPDRAVPLKPKDMDQLLADNINPPKDPLWDRMMAGAKRLQREFIDANAPLTGLKTKSGESVHALAQLIPGAEGAGQDVLRRFYKPIIRTVGRDVEYLKEYLSTNSMEDVLARNPSAQLPGGLQGAKGIYDYRDAILKAVGRRRYTIIQKAAADLNGMHHSHTLQRFVDEGMLSPADDTAMRSVNRHYFPFGRDDFDDLLVSRGIAQKSGANVPDLGTGTRAIEGSVRTLSQRAFNRYLNDVVRTEVLIARNRAAKGIVEAGEEMQRASGQELVRRVEPAGELRRAANVTGQQINVTRRPEMQTISYLDKGVLQVAEVPEVWAVVAKGLERQSDLPLFLKPFQFSASMFRGLAVTYNAFISPALLARDVQSVFVREGLTPLQTNFYRGMWAAIRKNADYTEAAQAKVFMSGFSETAQKMDIERFAVGSLQVSSPKDALTLLPRLIANLPRMVGETQVIAEQGVRVGTYKRLRSLGVPELEAAVRTRDASVDFAKAGNSMRAINQLVPFSNAALQGNINMLRALKDNPGWAIPAATMMSVTPTLISRINNMRFETSKDIPDYEYVRNWPVMVGEGTRKDGTKFPIYIKIPKGEIASIFSFPAEAIFSTARDADDRSALEMLFDYGVQAFGNAGNVPGVLEAVPVISTSASLFANRDVSTGVPIVPRREDGLRPELQFGEQTSAIALELGKKFNVSPRMIDYAIRDLGAGVGESSNWTLSWFLEGLGYDRPKRFGEDVDDDPPLEGLEAATRTPLVRRFVGTASSQEERKGWDDFNKIALSSNREFDKIPGMTELGIQLNDAPSTVSLLPGAPGTSLELTSSQMAAFQESWAKTVTPIARSVASMLQGTPEERKEFMSRVMTDARRVATDAFLDSLPRPSDPDLAAAWDFRKLRNDLGYEDIRENIPILKGDERIRSLYDRWKRNEASEVVYKAMGDPLGNEPTRALMRNIDAEIARQQKEMRRKNPALETGLVRYGLSAPTNPLGLEVQLAMARAKRQ